MELLSRYAHFEKLPKWKVGDKIKRGEIIGKMGNTGASNGIHLHFDLVQKIVKEMYRLKDLPDLITDVGQLMQQYHYFIDKEMFGGHDFKITTPFACMHYPNEPTTSDAKRKPWKLHLGFDLSSKYRYIHWNRSASGTVHKVGFDSGYGNYIIIRYAA